MNETIIQFIKKQTSASVCSINEQGNPYCFSCLYVFNSQNGLLYFKSSSAARHSMNLSKKSAVAGTILPDNLNVLLIKGIQFEGIVLQENDLQIKQAAVQYYKKNPAALAMPGEIWVIQIDSIKMTDSTFGFGKKITWKREAEILQ